MASTKKKASIAPIYAAAAAWLLYALLFPLYSFFHYIGAIAATIIVFLIASVLCSSGAKKADSNATKAAGERPSSKKVEKEVDESTGNPALDKMIKDGKLAISEMKRLDDNIEDEKISADIVRLQQTSGKIFDYVKAHPEKLSDIRKFMNYYLPTTLKLLNAYDRMSAQGVSGENIDTSLEKIRGMMGTIVVAFDKQLDSLFGAEALDISADITVLETMMAREGLTNEPQMKAETVTDENGIKLEL